MRGLLAAALFLLTSRPALPQSIDPHAWTGTWKLDRAASHLRGFVVTIHRLPHSYRFDLEGTSIEVGDDGKDYSTFPPRTTSFKQLNQTQWLRVHKMSGKVLDSSIFTLASNGRSYQVHTIATDDHGTKHVSDETFEREGTGVGIEGTWRSTSGGVNTPSILKIAPFQRGGLTFIYPTEGLSFDSLLDGSLVPYTGAGAVPSVRTAATVLTPTKIRHIDDLKGAPYQEEEDVLSNDGQSLLVRSWHVANPSDKDLAVYRR